MEISQLLSELELKDTKRRMAAVGELAEQLAAGAAVEPEQFLPLVGAAGVCLKDNNFRVSQGGLEVVALLVGAMPDDCRPHYGSLLKAVAEKLGDGKAPVRGKAIDAIVEMMRAFGPADTLERLALGQMQKHKNWRVREQLMVLSSRCLAEFDPRDVPMGMLTPAACALLDDPNASVRDCATDTLVELYEHVGEPLREQLERRQVRPAQLKILHERFDGTTVSKAALAAASPPMRVVRQPRSPKSPKSPKFPAHSEMSYAQPASPKRGAAGPIRVRNDAELVRELKTVEADLESKDWAVRQQALQRMQGVLDGGAAELPRFLPAFTRHLRDPIASAISDLRSSIVKEVTYVIIKLACELGTDFEPMAEYYVPSLLKLTYVTILVISESANDCVRRIIEELSIARMLPQFIKMATTDRNKILRTRCTEYLLLALQMWSAPCFDRCLDSVISTVRTCVADAVPETRAAARQAYWEVERIWPERAIGLLRSLDASTQRLILDEGRTGTNAERGRPAAKAKPKAVRTPVRSSQQSKPRQTRPVDEPPSRNLGPPSRSAVAAKSSSLHGRSKAQREKAADRPSTARSEEREAAARKPQPSASARPNTATADIAASREVEPEPQRPENFVAVLARTHDPAWAVRFGAFRELPRFCERSSVNEVLKSFDLLVNSFVDHSNDAHHRVTQSALASLAAFLEVYGAQLEPHLDRIAPRVFMKLTDNKEATRDAALAVVQAIRQTYHPDQIVPWLLHVLDEPNPKIRLACLDYLLYIMPDCSEFFSRAQNVKMTLVKAASLVPDRNADLRRVAGKALAQLQAIDGDMFMNIVASLSLAEQNNVKRALETHVADFSLEFASFLRQGQAPRGSPPKESVDAPVSRSPPAERSPPPVEPKGYAARYRDSKPASSPPQAVAATPAAPEAMSHADSEMLDVVQPLMAALSSTQAPGRGADPRNTALEQIADLSHARDPALWSKFFGQILLLVLEVLKAPEPDTREAALTTVTAMLSNQRGQFMEYIEILMAKLLECCKDSSREVTKKAEVALESLVTTLEPQRSLQVLIPVIISEEAPVLQTSIRTLSKLVPRLEAAVLQDALPSMLPGLFEAFSNPNADVRKAVVFALVDMHMVLGEDFDAYLGPLNASQLRLVRIYINRLQRQSES